MPRRNEHKIESNCVSFDDDCWNETQGQETYRTMYTYETQVIKQVGAEIQKTGKEFVEYLEEKLGLRQ